MGGWAMGISSRNWFSRLWTRLDVLYASGLAVDALTALTIWMLALTLSPLTEHSAPEEFWLAVAGTVVHFAVAMARGRYVQVPRPVRTDEVATNIISTMAGASAIIITALLLNWRLGAVEMLIGSFVVVSVLGLIGEVRRSRRRNRDLVPVVIIGTGDDAREVAELLLDHSETGFNFRGVIGDQRVAERYGLDQLWLGPIDRLISLMTSSGATRAIVAPSSFRSESFRMIVENLMAHGFDVALSSGVSRIGVPRHSVHSVAHEPLVVLEARWPSPVHDTAKRVVDIVGSIVGLVVAAPLLALAAVAILLDDRGPVFYRQQRIGRHGQVFSILKLRTMGVGTDRDRDELLALNQRTGPLFKVNGDRRITRVGRLLRELSLDELPQLFNVLKGDMSLVGPRPALPDEVDEFDDELRGRSSVRPGLTGLWQVEARTNASFSAYRRLDLHYVENRTFWLDSRIILATVQMVLAAAVLLIGRVVLRRKDDLVDIVEDRPELPPAGGDRESTERRAYDTAS
jgi:exopolysaccharide biosynthesis polyprenyl glycosylphosphotransferase